MSGEEKKHLTRNIRQIKNALFRYELSLKGTAPSFFNNESDRGKPGPSSNLSTKGYKHLEAIVKSEDNASVYSEEELGQIIGSLHKIAAAILYVRRERFDLFRAMLRVENDPGIIKRWQDGAEKDGEDWLRSYEISCREAAEMIEGIWPGTRLYVPFKREDEPVDSVGEAAERERRWGEQDSYRKINAAIERIMVDEGCGVEAAIGLFRDRLARDKKPDVSPRKIYKARDFVKEEKQKLA